MKLPEVLEDELTTEIIEYGEGKHMPYITYVERRGLQQGLLEGARESTIDNLEVRFGTISEEIIEIINKIDDISLLKRLRKKAIQTATIEEFELLLK